MISGARKAILIIWATYCWVTPSVLLQMAVIYVPALNSVFHTQPLPMFDLVVCLVLSSLVLFAVEIEKWLVRRDLIYKNN